MLDSGEKFEKFSLNFALNHNPPCVAVDMISCGYNESKVIQNKWAVAASLLFSKMPLLIALVIAHAKGSPEVGHSRIP